MQDLRLARRKKLGAKLEDMGLDVGIITSWQNIFYLTGFWPLGAQINSWNSFPLLVSTFGDTVFVCSQVYKLMLENDHAEYSSVAFSNDKLTYPFRDPFQAVKKALEVLGVGSEETKIGLEQGRISAHYENNIKKAIPTASYVSIDSAVMKLRYIKDAEEIAALKKAGRITNEVGEEVIHNHIEPGMTERDLARVFIQVMADKGASPALIQMFVGERSCYGNVTPTDKRIKQGDTILMDYGVRCDNGYCSDITRAAVIGKPSKAQKEYSKAVKDIITGTLEYIRPGRTAADIDRFAKSKFRELGFKGDKDIYGFGSDKDSHRLGHNVGLEPSEPFPICEANKMDVVEPNMCFAIEPGIYIDGVGIRLEDNIITTDTGVKNLTTLPYEIMVI